MKSTSTTENRPSERVELFRDVLVFQVKLLADGLRDLLLVPVSLIAGAISLLRRGDRPGTEFYNVLKHGQRAEHWINLFGILEERGLNDGADGKDLGDIDAIADRVEAFIVHEYNKGEVSAKARDRLNRALDALQKRGNRHKDDQGESVG